MLWIVATCALVGLLLWIVVNFVTQMLPVRLNFLEPRVPDNGGGTSPLRVRFGAGSVSVKNVMLAKKGLRFVSSFLIGMFPADVTEIRVDQYRLAMTWGLVRFIMAIIRGEERELPSPKLILRLVGVRVKVEGNSREAWTKHEKVVETGIESMNHSMANQLTALVDKTAPLPSDGSPPTTLSRLIDAIINAVDLEVADFHLSWESVEHACSAAASHDPAQQSAPSGERTSKICKGWVLGMQAHRFRLFKKCNPTGKPIITPRTMHVGEMNLYYDADGTIKHHRSNRREPGHTAGSGGPPAVGSSAAVRAPNDGDFRGVALTLSNTEAPAMREAYHNSVLKVAGITGTVLFPDVMCGILAVGRQPGGRSKLLGIDLEMTGVVVQLEPNQIYGFVARALPMFTMCGDYFDWCEETRKKWHNKALLKSTVPESDEDLRRYAKALGSPGSPGKDEQKRDEDELKRLDKTMPLAQIMLARMRVRGMQKVPEWDVDRPERVMTGAKWLLDALDPFEGLSPEANLSDYLVEADHDLLGPVTTIGEGGESESEEQLPPEVQARENSEMVARKLMVLQTDEPETLARLENLLYYAAQEWAYAEAEGPLLMEIDVHMSVKDAAILVYHPHVKQHASNERRSAGHEGARGRGGSLGEAPEREPMSRQNSKSSVTVNEREVEMNTEEAIQRRDELSLPSLAAIFTTEDFDFKFDLLMGSVSDEGGVTAKGVRCTDATKGAQEEKEGLPTEDDASAVGAASVKATAAGANELEDEIPVQLHYFSDALFPDAEAMRFYQPKRLFQGADLRVEDDFGDDHVGDGVAWMSILLKLGGTRVTDYGALEDGGVLPTLLGGKSTTSSDRGPGGNEEGKEGGTINIKLVLFSGSRLEVRMDCDSVTTVGLPGRMLVILDILLACYMGPPAAREAMEMDEIEEEVLEEEEEEATGGYGVEVLAPSARWEVLEKVTNAYLYFGKLNAKFAVRVDGFALLLPQDERDVHSNVLVAQCSEMTVAMDSDLRAERLSVDVRSFSVAPCVQGQAASMLAIDRCDTLKDAGVRVSLQGPEPEVLDVMRAGFPLKKLDLFPIVERQIVLPVRMKLDYSTSVTMKAGESPEAETNSLVDELVKLNSPVPSASDGMGANSEVGSYLALSEADHNTAVALLTGPEGDEDEEGETTASPRNAADDEEALMAGLYVSTDVKLHVMSGLRINVTDLDVAVLLGIATSLLASLEVGPAGDSTSPSRGNRTGASLLDRAQKRMVTSLRQAFRRADVNGDGILDRDEVENLLRHHLEGHQVDPAQREAEVVQFISILDADGTNDLDIDEFTTTMMKLMTDGPDEATLERGRRVVVTEAFKKADADNSGSLDVNEVAALLKEADPLRTRSELERQVGRFMEEADLDGDGTLDLEEFLALVRKMQHGSPHEGPLAPKVEEFRSWGVIESMLEGFKSLPELLAERPPRYAPEGFWKLFEWETHATKDGPNGQNSEAVQAKMVKAFDNYAFARDAWTFLVAPSWYHDRGFMRVGSLKTTGTSSKLGPKAQLMPGPVRPGTLVYCQQVQAHERSAPPRGYSAIRIQRLPDGLAPVHPRGGALDGASLSRGTSEPRDSGYVTGVRMPAPGNSRGQYRAIPEPVGLELEIDGQCELMVCFHDAAAVTRGGASSTRNVRAGTGEERSGASRQISSAELDMPSWVKEKGLKKTGMKIEAVLPGEDGAPKTQYVYRVFSVSIGPGFHRLGKMEVGTLPYFVLVSGGDRRIESHSLGRPLRVISGQRPSRGSSDTRPLRSIFRRQAKRMSKVRRSVSAAPTVRSSASLVTRKESSTESIEKMLQLGSQPRSTSVDSSAVATDPYPSWHLNPRYGLSAASHGMTSIAKSANLAAGRAASTALKIATISSAAGGRNTGGGLAGGALGYGSAAGGEPDATKQPRIRVRVTLLCEHGVLLRMDDLHRLKNTADNQDVEATLELAFRLPELRGGGACEIRGGSTLIDINGGTGNTVDRAPSARVGDRLGHVSMGFGKSPSVDSGLSLTLDFEHVASEEMLGKGDSLSMSAAFGMEGKYYNPRVHRSEYFIEPWSASVRMGDPRGEKHLSGKMEAERHLVLNATTGLNILLCNIMELQDYSETRYSTTSVYTELRDKPGDDDNRLLTIENHLGLPVKVMLEDPTDADKTMDSSKRKHPPHQRKTRDAVERSARSVAKIPASRYSIPADEKERKAVDGRAIARRFVASGRDGAAGLADTLKDRISTGRLGIPDAKKSLPTATVTIEVEGFQPVTGVPLDLLGRGTHVYKIRRLPSPDFIGDDRDVDFRSPRPTKPWEFEGLVVKFIACPAPTPSVLDMAMQLQTNVYLRNDLPRPLRVALSQESAGEPNTMVPVGDEVCLPFPVLDSRVLRLWRWPRALVGGEALGKALCEKKKARSGASTPRTDRDWGDAREGVDVGEEVSVPITPTTFDRKKKVPERHSLRMLRQCVSVERTDLAPAPDVVMHDKGDNAPALWRLYARAPYVIKNALACDIVLRVSQALPGIGGTSLRRRGKEGDAGAVLNPPSPAFAAPPSPVPATRGRFRLTPTPSRTSSRFRKTWGAKSVTPVGRYSGRGGGDSFSDTSEGENDSDDSDDSDDDKSDTESEEGEQEDDVDESCSVSGSAVAVNASRTPDRRAGHANDGGGFKWVLESGAEAKLEGMDMGQNLKVQVGFAPSDKSTAVSEWCQPYVIETDRHTNRTLLNKKGSSEAKFEGGIRGAGGARRPEFEFDVEWKHTPGNRVIFIYTKVWVVNKTGVALAYRAPDPQKNQNSNSEAAAVRRPRKACHRTDSDTMLFSRYLAGRSAGGRRSNCGGAGAVNRRGLPLMLSCRKGTLQTMPYAMAASAVDAPMYLSEPRSLTTEQPLPSTGVDGVPGDAGREPKWPVYCDNPDVKVGLPEEVVPAGARRVHLLTLQSDGNKTGPEATLVSFVPSRDCRVYVGLDKRLLKSDPGPPKWLALQGFEECSRGNAAGTVNAYPSSVAPRGFALFSRFCRGLSVVLLGRNVDHNGDVVEGRKGEAAAMYFVVVVRVSEKEAVKEVDVGPVAMHRKLVKAMDMRLHHRWRLKPHFQAGDPCYFDSDKNAYSVAELPEKLRGLHLMQILTSQKDKRVKRSVMASFQVLQRSTVLVCYDSRAAHSPPSWLARRKYRVREELYLPAAPLSSNHGYTVFSKSFKEGDEVKLGGNRATGARRMYFCLVYAHGDQSGRISAPPRLPTPIPPRSPASAIDASESGVSAPFSGDDCCVSVDMNEPSPSSRKGCAVEAARGANEDQVFRFWDDKANGKLVQTPLDLDRLGRGWCEPFRMDAVKTTGQARSPAGVFGVTIEALSGTFERTRVVTVWPRFVVRNDLRRTVVVLPTLEPSPKSGRDVVQSGWRYTKEVREGHGAILQAAKKVGQPAPQNASVVLYDFASLEDYQEPVSDERVEESVSVSRGGTSKQPRTTFFKRIAGTKKEKLPCVRLLSIKGGQNGETGSSGEGNLQLAELPTVPVALESIGKDSYVWLSGGPDQDDVLVRVSCRVLSNGVTIHAVLSDETPCPPLRIENRSSTQIMGYRLGGDEGDKLRILEPMRWNALHWIDEEKRYVEAAVYTGKRRGFTPQTLREHKRKLKEGAKKLFTSRSSHKIEQSGEDESLYAMGSESHGKDWKLVDDKKGDGDGEDDDLTFTSFQWANWRAQGFRSLEKYKVDDFGRMEDLVVTKDRRDIRLQVECLRPATSVATTVVAFSDTKTGVYGTGFLYEAPLTGSFVNSSESRLADVDQDPENDTEEVLGMFARLITDVHFEARFAGMVLNIIESTASGPNELAAFTVDGVEIGKQSGTPEIRLSVWHFQLDDMRPDSPHPVILAPLASGFNSHLNKNRQGVPEPIPSIIMGVERDMKVSLMHHMWVLRSIKAAVASVRSAVHVDFWIFVQDVVFASLKLTSSSPERARERAVIAAQKMVGQLLEAPASDATVDRIYVGHYNQSQLVVAVEFHLGTKVMTLLSSKPAADGIEEKDESGFGASLAMMPLGAMGGVAWGVLSSIGVGLANASPTFVFGEIERENYYGSTVQAVQFLVMSFVKQGIIQAYKVLGHMDILGDPLSLGGNISSGVVGFVKKTGTGRIGEGTKELLQGVVGGTASSTSKFAHALDRVVRSAGGLESSSETMEHAKAPEHLGQGMTQAVTYFGRTMKQGVTGVIMKPMAGARNKGVFGMATGVGKGIVGCVAAPVAGVLGATSKITSSIDATTHLFDDQPMGRRREPRHPLGAGERDDREKLKREMKKRRQKREKRIKQRRRKTNSLGVAGKSTGSISGFGDSGKSIGSISSYTDGGKSTGSISGFGDGGRDGGGRGGGKYDEDEQMVVNLDEDDPEGEGATIDLYAEAGGMGLLLVPLSPDDMRLNYPDKYLEQFDENIAGESGVLAKAEEVLEEVKVKVKEEVKARNRDVEVSGMSQVPE